ncbi:hypothetical protein [Niabella aurantiaca]|uniref:hypothetical protein n=1 Tax=Niabella aurantiaca TaxID=379900 RepID=UPI000363CB9D|nr:hypothetical protein [Niabella aurantiaca]
MKKGYLSVLLVTLLFISCSKDIFKRYEKRIIGDWEVEDINSYGFGSMPMNFGEGAYHFGEDRSFIFTDINGVAYTGKWQIKKYWTNNNCDGCSSDNIRTLMVSAVDNRSGELKADYFNEIKFTGTDRFNGTMVNGTRTRVFKFRRR